MQVEAVTVSQLTEQLRSLLEDHFEAVWVQGEIGNLSRPSSGHLYLSLKDEAASLRAVMFRSAASRLTFQPAEGDEVLALGTLSMYAPRGDVQLRLVKLVPKGMGKLQQRFEELRARLEAEGLFDPSRKRPLPFLPRRLALVTSPSGAAVHDMLRVLTRRFPGLDLVVVPTRVQGKGAELEIAAALDAANRLEGVDLILAGRGGGSLEDLWCFNEEAVARALFRSRVPVISAVGHEVDTTIADLVADLRAPTPSAAAELAVPERAELETRTRNLVERLVAAGRRRLTQGRERLDRLAQARALRDPLALLEAKSQRVDELAERLRRALGHRLTRAHHGLEAALGRLQAVAPQRVLERGFALLHRPGDPRPLREAAQASPGEQLVARLAVGSLVLGVEAVHPEGMPPAGPSPRPTRARKRAARRPSKPATDQDQGRLAFVPGEEEA